MEALERLLPRPGLDGEVGLGVEADAEDDDGEEGGDVAGQLPVLPLPRLPRRRRRPVQDVPVRTLLVPRRAPPARPVVAAAGRRRPPEALPEGAAGGRGGGEELGRHRRRGFAGLGRGNWGRSKQGVEKREEEGVISSF